MKLAKYRNDSLPTRSFGLPSLFDFAEWDSLFDKTFGFPGYQQNLTSRWSETEDFFENNIALAGIQKENIEVELKDSLMEVRVKQKTENSEEIYKHTFTLPQSIDRENINVNFQDGLLKITLPKEEKAKPRMLTIK